MSDRVLVFVGTVKGLFVYRSDRSRRSWSLKGPHLPGWEVSTLHFDDRRKPRLFAGTNTFSYGATIRRSDDLGKTWQQIEAGPSYTKKSGAKLNRIWQIVPGHETEPDTLYAGVDEAGLFASRDAGTTWSQVTSLRKHPSFDHWFPGNGGLCLHTILVDRENAKRMWLGISAVGVFRTEDGGKSWDTCNTGLPAVVTDAAAPDVGRCVHRMVLDPAKPGTLYQQFHGGVFRSTNGASTWQPIENGLPRNFGFPMSITPAGDLFVIPLESDEVRMLPKGRLRVYRSRNAGDSWKARKKGLPDRNFHGGILRDAMTIDSCDDTGVYFGTTSGEVFASRDRGDSWMQLPGTLPRILSVRTCVLS